MSEYQGTKPGAVTAGTVTTQPREQASELIQQARDILADLANSHGAFNDAAMAWMEKTDDFAPVAAPEAPTQPQTSSQFANSEHTAATTASASIDTPEDAWNAAKEMAARRVEADCLGFKEDDEQLDKLAADIRAMPYREPVGAAEPIAITLLRELADAADTHLKGGVSGLGPAINKAHALIGMRGRAPAPSRNAAPLDEHVAFNRWFHGSGFTKYMDSMWAAWEARAALTQQSAAQARKPFDFDDWFSEHSEGAQLRTGKELRDFERAIEEWASGAAQAAHAGADTEQDAARYRWLCANNFDRNNEAQVHTWVHNWEPHSQTGEPTEWKQRVRGGALDRVIDEAMKKGAQS